MVPETRRLRGTLWRFDDCLETVVLTLDTASPDGTGPDSLTNDNAYLDGINPWNYPPVRISVWGCNEETR